MEVTVRLRHSRTQTAATLEPEEDGVLLQMHTPPAPNPGSWRCSTTATPWWARPGLYEERKERDDGT